VAGAARRRAPRAEGVAVVRRVNSWLIFINVAVFALQMAEAELPLDQFALWPIGPQAVARFGPEAAFHW